MHGSSADSRAIDEAKTTVLARAHRESVSVAGQLAVLAKHAPSPYKRGE